MKSTVAFNCIYCKQDNIFTTGFVLAVATGEFVQINCKLCQRVAKYTIEEINYLFTEEDKETK